MMVIIIYIAGEALDIHFLFDFLGLIKISSGVFTTTLILGILWGHHYIKGHISGFGRGFIYFCCLEPSFLHGDSCPYFLEYWRVSRVMPRYAQKKTCFYLLRTPRFPWVPWPIPDQKNQKI